MSAISKPSLGPYELLAPIGAGGMGEVFRARDTRLNREVAIKMLPKEFATDPDRLRRFEQESKTLAALNHPNILTIHDAGVQDGTPYLVSELLEGKTLREELTGGPLPARKAAAYALQMAHGLAAAHGKGIVHRDLKPENIFLTKDGQIKILDFGLAKPRSDSPSEISDSKSQVDPNAPTLADSTQPGMVLGTPAYMSPEQVRGEPVDHRSDIFAFGCALYEMLSGARAFRRDTPIESMHAVLKEEPPALDEQKAQFPPALERIVRRCLEKQPENRFQSAKDLAFALSEIAPTQAPPASLWRPSGGLTGRAIRRSALVIATMAVLAAITGWLFWHRAGPSAKTGAPSLSKQDAPEPSRQPLIRAREVQVKGHDASLGEMKLAGIQAEVERSKNNQSASNPGGTSNSGSSNSVAVLPFVNLSPDKADEYLSDGMTEELLNALVKVKDLRVPGRSSSFAFKGKTGADLFHQVGEQLHVGAVLEGSVRKAGNRLRITADLINVGDGFRLWSEEYDRDLTNIFAVQSDIAARVAEALKVRLLGQTAPLRKPTESIEAYQLYLRGRQLWNQRTGPAILQAIGYFERATAQDPGYALAYAGLADCYAILDEYAGLPTRETAPKAQAAALKAIELDDKLAEPHAALASVRGFYDWDWAAAEAEFRRAIELNPNYATSYHWYGILLNSEGRFQEAVVQLQRAREIDPLSPIFSGPLARNLFLSGNESLAIEVIQKQLVLTPDFAPARAVLGLLRLLQGKLSEAILELEAARGLAPEYQYCLGTLGFAYARAGRTDDARGILRQLSDLQSHGQEASPHLALVHHGLGEDEEALKWLEHGLENRAQIDELNSFPLWKDLRPNPRAQALLRKMHLIK